jgi:hypothetical protein
MKLRTMAWLIVFGSTAFAGIAQAYDCSGLPQWKRQAYYLAGTEVAYQEAAYVNAAPSKRDVPDAGYPWEVLGNCDSTGGSGGGGSSGPPEPIAVYGAWHCSDDYCTWSRERDLSEFHSKNRWLISRYKDADCDPPYFSVCSPSVNLVVLSFVHPLKLLHKTTDEQTLNGLPIGMTQGIVDYFKNRGIRVMLSIGGITYVDAWNAALAEDAAQLGLNAAAVAEDLGVGIEIDYEENSNPDLEGLQAFIDAYRSKLPYDASGTNHAARLTIDLAAGDRWLIALTERATANWLNTSGTLVLDYANAMVTPRQSTAEQYVAHWQEHIDGKPQYDPPIPPLAPAKFTGSFWLTGRRPAAECVDFENSLQKSTGSFVQTVLPSASHPDTASLTHGMLGFMFWAAECEGTRTDCTTPFYSNTCEGGMGAAATTYEIPIPMPALRQQ